MGFPAKCGGNNCKKKQNGDATIPDKFLGCGKDIYLHQGSDGWHAYENQSLTTLHQCDPDITPGAWFFGPKDPDPKPVFKPIMPDTPAPNALTNVGRFRCTCGRSYTIVEDK